MMIHVIWQVVDIICIHLHVHLNTHLQLLLDVIQDK